MSRLSLLPNKAEAAKRRRSPARVEELAVLPVFYKLKGRRVVLAGSSDAAAWKGELLAAAGAEVHIYGENLDEAFETVMARQGARFVHHARPWAADCFEGAVIAIADAETEGEAQAFYCAALAAGVAVNVIDKPAFCQFQFGSIVNRSPTVVSISTDGAAPIFGQAIRRRIETLLPPVIQDWAKLAQSLRATVNKYLPMGPLRRRFWERFVDTAFAGGPADRAEAALLDFIHDSEAESGVGRVTLVGAGPGDAELLTLKAVRALQAADVILFDDLVSDDVLELARREAKRMLVGKRGGRDSCKQDDINATMLTLASAGKRVVRLKSGDPSVFGRAGEEITFLEKHGIAVDIIPGITSASAMAAQLGVSLTHRDTAQSVRFVTGHSREGKLPDTLNWAAVADPATTTIFYMGGRTAKQITQRLMSEGMSAATPVSICSNISRSDGAMWHGTLASLPTGIAEIGYSDPVLIGVGHVFENVWASVDSDRISDPTPPSMASTGEPMTAVG